MKLRDYALLVTFCTSLFFLSSCAVRLQTNCSALFNVNASQTVNPSDYETKLLLNKLNSFIANQKDISPNKTAVIKIVSSAFRIESINSYNESNLINYNVNYTVNYNIETNINGSMNNNYETANAYRVYATTIQNPATNETIEMNLIDNLQQDVILQILQTVNTIMCTIVK